MPKVYTTFDNPKFKDAYDVYEGDITAPAAALYRGTGMSIQITANFPGATIVHRAAPPATKDALTAHDAA